MAVATLLLPARDRLRGRALPERVARAIGRADVLAAAAPGEQAQLQRHFELVPGHWPVAALTRSQDAGDAGSAQWLRADPAWVRPDINGVRLFATGEGMQLSREDADALVPALRTLFGDAGFPIDAPSPSRWYLRLPTGARLPAFAPPEDALGTDLFDALVGTDATQDATRRRWRSLLSEAQVVLHNHPWNAKRAERGQAPVNSLWFWGGGVLPDSVETTAVRVQADDVLVRALAATAGAETAPRGDAFDAADVETLIDLREARDLTVLCSAWLLPALHALQGGRLAALHVDFGDGAACVLRRKQRWRVWRKAATDFSRLAPFAHPPGIA